MKTHGNVKHGHSTRVKGVSPTYTSWQQMLDRCNNKDSERYKDYGSRGITVCERWLSFENFLADMGERPSGLTLERINNEEGYFKNNCKWASYAEQNENKRKYKNNSSGYTGVSWDKRTKKWVAYINRAGCRITLGHFCHLENAVRARQQAEEE